MLEEARQFAIEAHGDQKYGDQPYLVHLEAVVGNLEDYGETARIVAYLHDVVEDTSVTCSEVEKLFGQFVADCVAILTDEPGKSRETRKSRAYEKMAKVEGEFELALLVKAADRLANIQACIADENERQLRTYKAEHSEFRSAVYRPNQCEEIWREIERAVGA